MSKLLFEEPYETRLKKLRVKQSFSYNVHDASTRYRYNLNKVMNEIIYDTWQTFVQSAFIWESTPEGHDFWLYISKLKT